MVINKVIPLSGSSIYYSLILLVILLSALLSWLAFQYIYFLCYKFLGFLFLDDLLNRDPYIFITCFEKLLKVSCSVDFVSLMAVKWENPRLALPHEYN